MAPNTLAKSESSVVSDSSAECIGSAGPKIGPEPTLVRRLMFHGYKFKYGFGICF